MKTSRQQLFRNFQGKILEDEKQLSDYNLTEKGFIVLMIVKPKPKPAEAPKPAEEPKAETSTETARYIILVLNSYNFVFAHYH